MASLGKSRGRSFSAGQIARFECLYFELFVSLNFIPETQRLAFELRKRVAHVCQKAGAASSAKSTSRSQSLPSVRRDQLFRRRNSSAMLGAEGGRRAHESRQASRSKTSSGKVGEHRRVVAAHLPEM